MLGVVDLERGENECRLGKDRSWVCPLSRDMGEETQESCDLYDRG
jgi:hypothetical protein